MELGKVTMLCRFVHNTRLCALFLAYGEMGLTNKTCLTSEALIAHVRMKCANNSIARYVLYNIMCAVCNLKPLGSQGDAQLAVFTASTL